MAYLNGIDRELYLSKASVNSVAASSAKQTQIGTSVNDVFQGSGGDSLVGGLGDDTYNLWDSVSTVTERAGEGIDTAVARFWGAATLSSNVENLTLAGPGSTAGIGNALDNIVMAGSVGATLDGKAGNDVLVGGARADVFKISAGNGSDAIVNFNPGSDAIVLQGYGIGSFDQLLKVAYQDQSDVALRFANGEKLVIRDVSLSELTAYDFGMKAPLAHEAGNTLLEGAGRCHTVDGWYIFNNVYNPGTLKYGINYTIDGSYDRHDVTGATTFNWSFPLVTEAFPTIRAYPEVIFGPAPMSGGGKASDTAGVFPIRLDALLSLVVDHDVSFQGNTSGFNVAYDIWFTDTPNGGASTITTELMVWVHQGDVTAYGKEVGTYKDGSISGKIYSNLDSGGNYIAIVLDKDLPKGQLDIGKMVTTLQSMGMMSASEYLASIELGAEVVSGAGSLKINNLDISAVQRGADGFTIVSHVDGTGTTKTLVANNSGDDRMIYDATKALIDGGSGHDTLVLKKAASVDLTLGVAGATKITGFESVDASSATGGVKLTGSAQANTLIGGVHADVIHGGGGNDVVDGGAGRDQLFGDDGNDRIVYDKADSVIDGGAGLDTLVLKAGAVVDLGRFSSSQVTGGAYVTGFENVDASRATGGVNLTGSAQANTLIGGVHADIIHGGGGFDTLTGGAGQDIFRFDSTLSKGYARITDFSANDDKIELDSDLFGLTDGKLSASAFHVGTAATSAEHRIIYNSANGELFIDADGSGTGSSAFHFATLSGNSVLNEWYFTVI